MQSHWVVKLGGSLMQSKFLPHWLDRLQANRDRGIVIVPGGGVFADHARQLQQRWRFNDDVAHKLALRAMEQYGLVLQALATELVVARTRGEIENAVAAGKTALWFPYEMVADNPEIAASWDITSDSLALWLAEKLHYPNMAIVKSTFPEKGNYSIGWLSEKGYLDKAFHSFFTRAAVKVCWFGREQVTLFDALLRDGWPGSIKEIRA